MEMSQRLPRWVARLLQYLGQEQGRWSHPLSLFPERGQLVARLGWFPETPRCATDPGFCLKVSQMPIWPDRGKLFLFHIACPRLSLGPSHSPELVHVPILQTAPAGGVSPLTTPMTLSLPSRLSLPFPIAFGTSPLSSLPSPRLFPKAGPFSSSFTSHLRDLQVARFLPVLFLAPEIDHIVGPIPVGATPQLCLRVGMLVGPLVVHAHWKKPPNMSRRRSTKDMFSSLTHACDKPFVAKIKSIFETCFSLRLAQP